MSLYNLMHGMHPLAGILLGVAGLDHRTLGRFRDCYLGRSESGELEIHVFTRNGGGNREHFRDGPAGMECGCYGCVITHHAPKMPGYVRDFDDEFDSTYATIVFSIPEKVRPALEGLVQERPDSVPASHQERFEAFMKKIKERIQTSCAAWKP